MEIVVIGAGSIGANIAFRLSADGHAVTVVDSGSAGRGTSNTSIAWLSRFPQSASVDSGELDVRRGTHSAFRSLEGEIGGGWIHWTDTLTWAADPRVAARLDANWRVCTSRGVDVEALSAAEAMKVEPLVSIDEGIVVYAEHGGGWVDAPSLVRALLEASARRGARVVEHSSIIAIQSSHGHVTGVQTAAGEQIAADVVVDAAGSWASHVAALAGCTVPVDLRPGLVVFTEPLPGGPLRNVVSTPILSIRPDVGGGIAILCRPESMFSSAAYSKNAYRVGDVLDQAKRWLPCLGETAVRDVRVGIRPIPPGGPIIGFHPSVEGFYIAVSHGGIGWGPTWGSFAAREIGGTRVPGLERWRPERFLSGQDEIPKGELVGGVEVGE